MKKIILGLLVLVMLLGITPARVFAAAAEEIPAVAAEEAEETTEGTVEEPVTLQTPVVTVTGDPATGKAALSWEPVEGATGYGVYRSTNSKKNFKQVAAVAETAYTFQDGTLGKKYYYKVKALGAETEYDSEFSKTVSHTCVCPQPAVTATGGKTGGIKLSWQKVAGAKKYQVYRSDSPDGTYTKIKTTSSRTYTDTKAPKNQVSYYKVRAYGEDTKTLGAFSAVAEARNHTFSAWKTEVPGMPESEGLKARTCSDCGHREETVIPMLKRELSKPKLTVTSDSKTGKPKLSWKSVEDADGYYIYLVDAEGVPTFLADTAEKTYIHRDAVTGSAYTYRVMAVSDTACSDYSAAKTGLCKCARPALTITGEELTGNPVLSWEAVEGAGEYVVYRSTSSDQNFKELTRTGELRFTVTGGTAGKTHYYRVKAIGTVAGTDSASGTAVKHVWDCAQPVISVSGVSGGLKISWEKVAGAKKYQVYRSDSEDGTFTKIKTTSGLSYTDTKAPKNQVSYYKVRAYGASTESMGAYSAAAFGLNHTFSDWVTVLESSPEAEGLQEKVCTGCGETVQQTTPRLKLALKTPQVSLVSDEMTGKPLICWKKISKATAYRVYLVDASGNRQYLATTDQRSFLYAEAAPGDTYTFCVAAVSAAACSDYSQTLSVLCKCAVPQLKLDMDPDTYTQTLSWEPVAGAAEYDVYQAASKTGEYTLLTHTREFAVTIPDTIPGVPLYFKIQAKHTENPEADSPLSDAATLDGQTTILVIHAGTTIGTGNKVVWNRVKGARSYEVYRATEAEGTFKKIATVKGSEHVDLSVLADTVCSYMVKAIGAKKALLATSQVEAADKLCQVPLKIYVSPSSQVENPYCYGDTNEARECRKIAKVLVASLERCGFTAMTNVKDEMDVRVPESNAWGANLHVAIHSNAFNESAMGTQIYHDGVSGSVSMKATKAIFKELAPLSPGSSGETTRKHADYYEFNENNNPVTYIEVGFHDTKEEAKWIIKNTEKIAEAICKGICKTYGVTYIAP